MKGLEASTDTCAWKWRTTRPACVDSKETGQPNEGYYCPRAHGSSSQLGSSGGTERSDFAEITWMPDLSWTPGYMPITSSLLFYHLAKLNVNFISPPKRETDNTASSNSCKEEEGDNIVGILLNLYSLQFMC